VALALTAIAAYLITGSHDDTPAGRQAAAGASSSSHPTSTPTPTPTPTPVTSTFSPSNVAANASPPATDPTSASSQETPSPGAALAGRIRPGVAYHGVATAYASGDGSGACLFDPTDDPMIAAMNVADYESAKACGATVLIHAANGASITVRIVNECPAPCAPGQIDLSQQAFAKLAALKVGRLAITWSLLSPATTDDISIRYKTGSSRWWCGLQVIGHRNPVAALEVQVAGKWRQLPRTDYNYFISADGSGCGGAIRVTDIYGQQLVIKGIALSPNVAQRTTVQFAQH
jgi:expansin (peptidoglycan-binding protein)